MIVVGGGVGGPVLPLNSHLQLNLVLHLLVHLVVHLTLYLLVQLPLYMLVLGLLQECLGGGTKSNASWVQFYLDKRKKALLDSP